MITILHGDDVLYSRKALESAKLEASGKEILTLEGKKVNLTLLKQALEAKSLFKEEKLVVVENLLIPDTRHQVPEIIISYLLEGKFSADLLIWENKTLPAPLLTKFKKTKNIKIQLFKQPVVIFKFLDSLSPQNTKAMLNFFRDCLKVSEPKFIFYMLVRQFRMLLAVKSISREQATGNREHIIDEVKKLAPWQMGKLKKQAGCFTLEDLLKIYKELLIIDYQVKTGRSPLDLTKRIELFIMSL